MRLASINAKKTVISTVNIKYSLNNESIYTQNIAKKKMIHHKQMLIQNQQMIFLERKFQCSCKICNTDVAQNNVTVQNPRSPVESGEKYHKIPAPLWNRGKIVLNLAQNNVTLWVRSTFQFSSSPRFHRGAGKDDGRTPRFHRGAGKKRAL